eukprot:scaffold2292_cov301-Pavlova_lutheri.AAC.19
MAFRFPIDTKGKISMGGPSYGRSGSDSHGPIRVELGGFVVVLVHASHVLRHHIHKSRTVS